MVGDSGYKNGGSEAKVGDRRFWINGVRVGETVHE